MSAAETNNNLNGFANFLIQSWILEFLQKYLPTEVILILFSILFLIVIVIIAKLISFICFKLYKLFNGKNKNKDGSIPNLLGNFL